MKRHVMFPHVARKRIRIVCLIKVKHFFLSLSLNLIFYSLHWLSPCLLECMNSNVYAEVKSVNDEDNKWLWLSRFSQCFLISFLFFRVSLWTYQQPPPTMKYRETVATRRIVCTTNQLSGLEDARLHPSASSVKMKREEEKERKRKSLLKLFQSHTSTSEKKSTKWMWFSIFTGARARVWWCRQVEWGKKSFEAKKKKLHARLPHEYM